MAEPGIQTWFLQEAVAWVTPDNTVAVLIAENFLLLYVVQVLALRARARSGVFPLGSGISTHLHGGRGL